MTFGSAKRCPNVVLVHIYFSQENDDYLELKRMVQCMSETLTTDQKISLNATDSKLIIH